MRAQSQGLALRNPDCLVYAGVDTEIAVAPEVVSLAGFSWVSVPEVCRRGATLNESGGISVRSLSDPAGRRPRTIINYQPGNLEVGWESSAVADAEGQATRPPRDASDLPSPN